MKKLMIVSLLILNGLPLFAQQVFEMDKNNEYMFFSDSKIKSIKSNNPSIISAQRVYTYTGDENQIIFYPKKTGIADVQIETDQGVSTYTIEIKKNSAAQNSKFIQLDIPGNEK